MTSERPPSCRPQLFLLRSLRSFAAPFICANLRPSADPFRSLPFAFSLSLLRHHEPFGIILKEPEIRGDPSRKLHQIVQELKLL
jgi:hypothetical protein